MEKLRFVGLDVHAESIAIAVADAGNGPAAELAKVRYSIDAVIKALRKLGSAESLRCCYEAGPTGFVLARQLTERGYNCIVVAPSLVPSKSGDRIKTDRRDAVRLAHFLRSGDLTEVYVPDVETEAFRDLVRARDAAVADERAARNRLTQFLLRHGHRFDQKGKRWAEKHLRWAESLPFEHEAQLIVRNDLLKAVRDAKARVQDYTGHVERLADTWSGAPVVQALRALRGVDVVSAVILLSEIGSFMRFKTAPELMAYLGLVPSENSSGNRVSRGAITKAGNVRARTALIESAHSYRFRPNMSRAIAARNKGLPEQVQRHAWKAQQRLHSRYAKLMSRRMPTQKVVTAVARELAGFVWAIARSTENARQA